MVAYGKEVYGIDLKSWHQVVRRLHTRDGKRYGVVSMCRLLGVSKQAYYKHEDKLLDLLCEESFVVSFVKEVKFRVRKAGFVPSVVPHKIGFLSIFAKNTKDNPESE